MDGWIKLHRKMLENPIVCKDSDHLAVWIYLLMHATHKEYAAVFSGEKVTLQPGQLITGRHAIASQLSISESKVKRILIEFESDQQIGRQRSNKNSLVTILNWEKYQVIDQQDDQQVTSYRPASDQQVTTNKNVKKEKKERTKEDLKIMYASNVSLTELEYQRLCEKYGKELTDESITYLSLYKEEKQYKNKSDSATIQRWVVDAVRERRIKTERQRGNVTKFPQKPRLPVQKVDKPEATQEDIERILSMAKQLDDSKSVAQGG